MFANKIESLTVLFYNCLAKLIDIELCILDIFGHGDNPEANVEDDDDCQADELADVVDADGALELFVAVPCPALAGLVGVWVVGIVNVVRVLPESKGS